MIMTQKLQPYNYQVVGLILDVAILQNGCKGFVIKLSNEQASEEVVQRNTSIKRLVGKTAASVKWTWVRLT